MKEIKQKEDKDSQCIKACLNVFYYFDSKYDSPNEALLPAAKVYRLYYPKINEKEAKKKVLYAILKDKKKFI